MPFFIDVISPRTLLALFVDISMRLSFTYSCWKRRNTFVFQNQLSDATNLLQIGCYWAKHYDSPNQTSLHPLIVQWETPPQHWICLNTDGAVSQVSGNGSIGGILRNSAGDYIFGYTRKIRIVDVLQAELWSILIGLRLASNLGYGHVIVQSDNYDAITLLSPPLISTPHSLVCSISMLLE
ncbi:hypothetical protein V6N11_012254 [Hibiscus sabdariffa]|uniref:RNase H type-1 domain-containing protein n=1 Tax=Hibiscus sabdariffa TaxID=183260 RepID=A0ABR2QAP7_9ROSI